jgi:hypothetical protein
LAKEALSWKRQTVLKLLVGQIEQPESVQTDVGFYISAKEKKVT